MKEECRGCLATCNNSERLKFTDRQGNVHICPCVDCLVKPTCVIICKPFHKYEIIRQMIKKRQFRREPHRQIERDGHTEVIYLHNPFSFGGS